MASTSYGSSSGNNYVYDIFINHRGPDCKKTLAKHLYDRLNKHGLRVFLDEDELQAGEYITPQIQSAIRTASVHIAIFSPRYAESNWCLDELLLMFESRATIIPVFYGGVKPSDLRWGTQGEKGVYGRALQTLEKKTTLNSKPRYDPSTIQKWRKALTDAAEIKGFDMETYNGDEQQLLQQVVEGALQKVKRALHVSRYPTALDEKVEEFERAMLLEQQSIGTRVIGIFGLGGVGKTTLAKEIFNRRRSNYKQSCFLFDVRENVARNSLKSLQAMILSDFGIKENVKIHSTDDGIEKLQRYLRSSHAFLILDDVDHLQQVEALLLPVRDVVRQGSLILVTSRNKDILQSSGIPESSIFKLTGLRRPQSRELFCCHAFDQRYPPIEFEQVVEEFVHACAGLPLSLKVLGGLLRGKDLEYGKAQLHKISKILPDNILATLKISYDGLDRIEKQIFLDIVCFFIGENKDSAIRLWDGTEWGGWLGLRNLESRCLVEVDDKNCIRIHDHLRDLGRHIAETEPPEWTLRLSCPIHSLRHLSHKSLVHGISTIHSSGCESAHPVFRNLADFAGSSFTNYVRGLQLIRTEGGFAESEFMKSIFSIAISLKWLSWVDFPYSYIPSWIPLNNLRVLRIDGTKLETLWLHESQAPERLRELYIEARSESMNFLQPNVNLKVPRSIGNLKHLEKIVLLCFERPSLPDELWHLQSLKHLEIRTYFGTAARSMLEGLSNSITNSRSLENPNVQRSAMEMVQRSLIWIERCMLPDSVNLMSLENLTLTNWHDLEMLPGSFGGLTNLKTIDLEGSRNLRALPESFGNLTNLQTVNLHSCWHLGVLPDSFGNLKNLQTIDLSNCYSLQALPDSFGNLTNLQTIYLSNCYSLQALPDSFGNLTNLQAISLRKAESLQVLPDSFGNLTNLRAINLLGCVRLQMLPNSFGNLTNLQTIDLQMCCSLQVLPDSFGDLTSLRTIELCGCFSLQVLPDSFGNLKNLQSIDLTWCRSLRVLPESFGNLIQLENLKFDTLTVYREVFEKMHTFKCSGVINFDKVAVWPSQCATEPLVPVWVESLGQLF